MIRFFKRKKRPALSNGLLKKWSAVWEKRQRRWAARLTEKTSRIPVAVLKRWVIVFCAVLGTVNIVIGVRALYAPARFERPHNITIPAQLLQPREVLPEMLPRLSAEQWANLQRYRRYMDSLRLTPSGQVRFDSLQRLHPGLLDSITLVETLYHNNPKTKQ